DEVVMGVFRAPHSYTGEDVVEFSCHGSTYIQQRMLQLCISKGARLARPGEFTLRAFLNGKLDLSRAEGVADLIMAGSEASHRIALQQMRGGFSKEIRELRSRMLHFVSMIELELDFGEEDVEFANRSELIKLLNYILLNINRLADSFRAGNVIKNGIPVSIIGRPNVGKSTLLNLLLNDDKAIVSEVPGTTRDIVEDTIIIEGIIFRFIDTAGIRDTRDKVETLGIRKTNEKIRRSDLVLLLVEVTDSLKSVIRMISRVRTLMNRQENSVKKLVLVVNKIDKADRKAFSGIKSLFSSKLGTSSESKKIKASGPAELKNTTYADDIVFISAKKRRNLAKLTRSILKQTNLACFGSQDIVVTNVRHYEALTKAQESLERAKQGLKNDLPSDLLATDIRQAIHYLGEITGEITTDEILGNIFRNFCIGK
ncbi:MAG: tRNA uridine-5-carboxymethylaminomethyl(34) synthesis GTPase MnmE, partial [Bacteroidetes bacterium]|nr:tRNA uridine-5-carboxymethylaminomethyl(34) synthesis GTPase MnmE [Bacteroidota bacterium]